MKWIFLLVVTALLIAPVSNTPSEQQRTTSGRSPVAGTWLSNFGPITFVLQMEPDGTHIRGFLQQGPGMKGTITDGHYDAEQRKLTFTYFQKWNSKAGTATLMLSPDGKSLTGTWRQGKSSGPYTMRFLFSGAPPEASEAFLHGIRVKNKPRLEVLPVLFIARDADWITQYDVDLYSYLIFKYLELAQQYYKAELRTDTFKISDEPLFVYRGQYDDAHYLAGLTKGHRGPDTGQMIAREILRARHEDRYSTNKIYLTVYVRKYSPIKQTGVHGGGRTLNGAPNTGGGSLELELVSLLTDKFYAFSQGLAHELGHAFGLRHVDVYGYDQRNNGSVMSYNKRLTTRGLSMAQGHFNPEEFYMLAQNKRAFPDFHYEPALHNPERKSFKIKPFLCMTDYIGQRRGFKPNSCMKYPCPCHR